MKHKMTDGYLEATNPSNGWRAPDGAEEMEAHRWVKQAEQSPVFVLFEGLCPTCLRESHVRSEVRLVETGGTREFLEEQGADASDRQHVTVWPGEPRDVDGSKTFHCEFGHTQYVEHSRADGDWLM